MKGRTILLTALAMAGAVSFAGPPAATAAPALIVDPETTRAIDGDTLQIDGTVLQLQGIDAPELGQTCVHKGRAQHCGLDAAYKLRQVIEKGVIPKIVCVEVAAPADGARVATCREGDRDLSEIMLRAGYAVALPGAAASYVAAERAARRASLGIWGTVFALPRDWRRVHEALNDESRDRASCPIKGKTSDEGLRLYYSPLDDEYEGLRIDRANGDRMFCSDDEARLDGWKRPKEGM